MRFQYEKQQVLSLPLLTNVMLKLNIGGIGYSFTVELCSVYYQIL